MSKEFLKINIKQEVIKARLKAFSFMENDIHVVYLPSLNMSGYGNTIEEAYSLLKLDWADFGDSLFELKHESLIFDALRDLGWSRHKVFAKRMNNLSNTTFEDIKKEFNIPDSTQVKEELIAV